MPFTNETGEVPDSVIYDFINFLVQPKELGKIAICSYLIDRPYVNKIEDSLFVNAVDSVFSHDDAVFMLKQYKEAKMFTWQQKYITNKEVISYDTVKHMLDTNDGATDFWEKFRKKYKSAGYCTISMPLFSKDLKRAEVTVNYHCGGLCGGGSTLIYKKTEQGWQMIKSDMNWIS